MSGNAVCKIYREIQFWTKAVGAICVLLLGALYYCIKYTFTGRSYYNSYNTIYLWQSIAWVVGMKHRVHGKENLVKEGPRILVVNHQSALDIPALIPVWPKCSTFVAKTSIATYATFGLLVWYLRAILIDRSNHDDCMQKLAEAARIVRDEKVSVIIFPEGTRGDGKKGLLPFKKGAFHLAIEAQVPIQPIVIAPFPGIDVSKRMAVGGFCDIYVLPSISTLGMTTSDVAELADKVQQQMSNVFMTALSEKNPMD